MKDINYYENTQTTYQKSFVKLQNHCVLCNSALDLKFEPVNEGEIKEEAHCPQCEVRTRAKVHSLQ